MKVTQAYRFALDPTPGQERALRSHAGASRFAWNWGLARCRERYDAEGRWYSAAELHRLWNAQKKADPALAWWSENSKCAYQESFRDLDRALKDFYGSTDSAADFFAIQDAIFALRARVRRWAAGFDVIVSPVCAGTAPPHDTPPAGVPREDYLRYSSFNYTHTSSVAGLSATAVPVAIDAGLPVGVQVIGPAWREDLVLAASAALERAFGGSRITDPLREQVRRAVPS